jgi:hypothetical protein
MMTSETRLMSELLRDGPLRAERVVRIAILGAPASIYMCRYRNG